jgi:hypothetical protein
MLQMASDQREIDLFLLVLLITAALSPYAIIASPTRRPPAAALK